MPTRIATLAARPGWALALLEAVERGRVPRRDISVTVARQLLAFADPRIRPRLEAVWGKVQPTSKTKADLVSKYKLVLASTQESASGPRAWPGRFQPCLPVVPQAF